tara:strand:+ start:81 stop:308 length:228 start_codon:yes stop_codon:yes gene_type:complete
MSSKVHKLDLLGKKCPIPVLKISKKIKEINNGDTVEIKTDDPKADHDIEELCKNINIKILNKKKLEYYLYVKIKK